MNYRLVSYLNSDTFSLLESLPLIESEYTISNPSAIPLLESKDYQKYIVKYNDLESLSEEYDITINDSINLLAHTNLISKDNIIVAIEESRPYYDSDILYRFFNEYVLIPEYNTPAYNLCDYCMTNFLESHDPFWIELYVTYPEITLSIQEAVVGKENKPGYLENMLSEIKKRIEDTKQSINNPLLIDKEKKHLTGVMTALDKQAMEIEEKIKERDGLQAARRKEKTDMAAKVDATSKRELGGTSGNAEMEAKKTMSTDARKMMDEKNKEIQQLKSQSGTTPQSNAQAPDISNQSQSWLSKKWSAFKNWWGNAGTPNGDNGSGGGGWFSNLVGKIKQGLGINTQQQTQAQPASNTNNQPTTNPTPQTSATAPVSNEPAKPAQPVAQTQSDAAKQKAQEQNQANIAKYNENKRQAQQQVTAPAQPVQNKK